MSTGKGATVPITLTVGGVSESVAAIKKVAKESREAWLASLPPPQFIDSFEKSSKKAAATSSDVARAIRTDWGSISAESKKAAIAMDEVAEKSKKLLQYSSIKATGLGPQGIGITTIDRAVVSSRALRSGTDALAQSIRLLPSLGSALGLSQLGLGVERLHVINRLVQTIRAAGLARVGAAIATTGPQILGIAAGATATAYAGWAMWKTAETKAETMQSREENNLKLLASISKFVIERKQTGEIRAGAEGILEEVKKLTDDQTKAKKDSDPVRNAVGSNITSQAADLLKRTTALIQASYQTEQEGAQEHMVALAEINRARLEGEREVLQIGLSAELQDREASEEKQIQSAEAYAARMRGISSELATLDKEVLDNRQVWLQGILGRVGNDPDEKLKIQNQLQAIEDERLLKAQQTADGLERIEAEHERRVQDIRAKAAAARLADEEKLRREQEKAIEDAERAAKQAQRDADRLLQTKQNELSARMAAVSAAYQLTNAEKYELNSTLIQQGRAEGSLTGSEADALQSRQGPDPQSIRQQITAASVELQNAFGTTAQAIAAGFRNVIGTAVNSISDGITGLIMRTKTWGEALREIGVSILTSIVRAIVQMGVQWAIGFALQRTLGKAAVKAAAGDAVSLAAAWGPAATLASIATMGSAAGVGLSTTVAATAAGTGAGVAMSAAGAGFQEGGFTGAGPRDQVAGYVHRGEFVLNAQTVQRVGVPALQALQLSAGGGRDSAPSPSNGGGVVFAAFDSRVDAERWANTQEAEVWFMNMARKTAHRHGRAS